eukprot:5124680-Alexandrium_andersonii.AAC.1
MGQTASLPACQLFVGPPLLLAPLALRAARWCRGVHRSRIRPPTVRSKQISPDATLPGSKHNPYCTSRGANHTTPNVQKRTVQ